MEIMKTQQYGAPTTYCTYDYHNNILIRSRFELDVLSLKTFSCFYSSRLLLKIQCEIFACEMSVVYDNHLDTNKKNISVL